MYTTNMRYTFVSCKGNHGQIVIKKSGAFGKVLLFEERVVKSVCCFRGERDRLWLDG